MDIVERLTAAHPEWYGNAPTLYSEAAAEITNLRQRAQELEREAAQWKNNHETEVRRARVLKERTDMPLERVQAYEKWGEDQARIASLEVEILLMQEAVHSHINDVREASRLFWIEKRKREELEALFACVGVSPEEVQKFRHIKTGNIYSVFGEAVDCTNSRADERSVIYGREGNIFVREAHEFYLKFEKVS